MFDLETAEEEFNKSGTLMVVLSHKESAFLKKSIRTLLKLESVNSQSGLKHFLLRKIYVIKGILISLRLSFLSKDAAEVFDFFAINKSEIGEVEAKDIENNRISFTFTKK